MRVEVGQLWRWSEGDVAWTPSYAGKCFLVVERFTHTNSFGDKYDAVRFVMDGEIDWHHEEDILMYAEVIDDPA